MPFPRSLSGLRFAALGSCLPGPSSWLFDGMSLGTGCNSCLPVALGQQEQPSLRRWFAEAVRRERGLSRKGLRYCVFVNFMCSRRSAVCLGTVVIRCFLFQRVAKFTCRHALENLLAALLPACRMAWDIMISSKRRAAGSRGGPRGGKVPGHTASWDRYMVPSSSTKSCLISIVMWRKAASQKKECRHARLTRDAAW